MTREESLNILHNASVYHPDYLDALNMAIKALEQESTIKNDLGVDCISRAQTQTEIEMSASRYTIARERGGMGQVEWSDQLIKVSDAVAIIRNLPSVIPQEPKTGHWIEHPHEAGSNWELSMYECSECHDWAEDDSDYCPYCGAKMIEPQESEEV